MKKISLLCISILLSCNTLFAGPIGPERALQTARGFVAQHFSSAKGDSPMLMVADPDGNYPNLYCYNVEGGGFVIVLDNDAVAQPVVGYAPTSTLDLKNAAPALRYMLYAFDRQVADLHNGAPLLATATSNGTDSIPPFVNPLLHTTWNQYTKGFDGYNSALPYDDFLSSVGYHPTVGCVPLAMGQVMRYWSWPEQGVGSASIAFDYPCWRYDTLYADFGATTYLWDSMPNSINRQTSEAQVQATATMLMHCGIASRAQYNSSCSGSTGAFTVASAHGLTHHFRYQPTLRNLYRFSCPDDSLWTQLMLTEVAEGRPVIYSGFGVDSNEVITSGHAFVLDGYDQNHFFHFNFGWGGSADAYFSLNSITPSGYAFNHGQEALFGVQPHTQGSLALTDRLDSIRLECFNIATGGRLKGHCTLVGRGDTVDDFYVAAGLIDTAHYCFVRYIATDHLTVAPGDSIDYHFDVSLQGLPAGRYAMDLFRSNTPIDTSKVYSEGLTVFPTFKYKWANFSVIDGIGVEQARQNLLQVYPNPARHQATLCGDGIRQVKISTIQGLTVRTLGNTADSDRIVLTLDHLPNGIYLVSVQMADGSRQITRLVVK